MLFLYQEVVSTRTTRAVCLLLLLPCLQYFSQRRLPESVARSLAMTLFPKSPITSRLFSVRFARARPSCGTCMFTKSRIFSFSFYWYNKNPVIAPSRVTSQKHLSEMSVSSPLPWKNPPHCLLSNSSVSLIWISWRPDVSNLSCITKEINAQFVLHGKVTNASENREPNRLKPPFRWRSAIDGEVPNKTK